MSVRDPGKATALAGRGVRVRRGDYDDAASLAHAFEGAEQLLLVSAATTGEPALRQLATAIDAARAAGVRRIVYTSHMGANPASAFAPMPDHAATEAMLPDSGLAFTALRNGFYTSSGRMLLGRALETGEVAAPAGRPGLLDRARRPRRRSGDHPHRRGPLRGRDAAAHRLRGRRPRGPRRDRRRRHRQADHPHGGDRRAVPGGARRRSPSPTCSSACSPRAGPGEFAAVDPTLEQLLGRPPLTVREVLAKG